MLGGLEASQGTRVLASPLHPPLPNPAVDSEIYQETSTHTEPIRRKPGGHNFLFLNESRGSRQSPKKVEFGRWKGREG